jgi:poly-gamma-glutamate capsule biosynthesis protein CapA/YwtB (metallophosphatase superfamily)
VILLALLAAPTITLAAVGDVMLDRYVGRHIDQEGPGYPLKLVEPYLAGVDILVGNLECPVTAAPPAFNKHYVFQAKPQRLAAVKRFTLFGLANNHALDCGERGLDDTIANLDRLGIGHAGAGSDLDRAWMPVVVERKGIKVAFVSYTDFAPGQGAERMAVYDEKRLRQSIRQAKKWAHAVIVLVHWGVEDSREATARQKREAMAAAHAGADLILGSHPHVLQPIEWIGHTVVVYSMGNFIFDSPNLKPEEKKTALYTFRIGTHGVVDSTVTPLAILRGRPYHIREK